MIRQPFSAHAWSSFSPGMGDSALPALTSLVTKALEVPMVVHGVEIKRLAAANNSRFPIQAGEKTPVAVRDDRKDDLSPRSVPLEFAAPVSWRVHPANDVDGDPTGRATQLSGDIVVIEGRIFFGECVARSLRAAFPANIRTLPDCASFMNSPQKAQAALIIVYFPDWFDEVRAKELSALSEAVPDAAIILLGHKVDLDAARAALNHGARGYITASMGFDIAIEAARFVLAGGTYVPAQCIMAGGAQSQHSSGSPTTESVVTERELAVMRAIRQGKPNKVIAYELNMSESTVKVHVRHIMKKLSAKNRTEVAIKSTLVI